MIKKYLGLIIAGVGVIGVLLSGFFLFKSVRGWEERFLRLDGQNREIIAQAAKEKADHDAERLGWAKERGEWVILKANLGIDILNLEAGKSRAEKERDQAKAQIATMPIATLRLKIGERVGDSEIMLTALNRFDLSRLGGERALAHFLDGETSEANYQSQLKITLKYEDGAKADKGEIGRLNLEIGTWKSDYGTAKRGWDVATEENKVILSGMWLKKAIAFVEGGVVATLIIFMLKGIGILK